MENFSDIRKCCLNGTHVIAQNLPKPKHTTHGSMVNTSAIEPVRFALLIASEIAMMCPQHIIEDMESIKNNMIGHGKGLQEEFIELANQCSNYELE